MQVSSQTCSCTEKRRTRRRREGVRGINPESAALPLPPFLSTRTASWEAHRHSAVRHSQAFLASLPPLTERWVCPPIYTSVWSPAHIKQQQQQQQQPGAHLIGQLSEWSESLITSEAADSSFSDSCSSHTGANIKTQKSASMSHMQISENCPCPYIPAGANLHFLISPSGR